MKEKCNICKEEITSKYSHITQVVVEDETYIVDHYLCSTCNKQLNDWWLHQMVEKENSSFTREFWDAIHKQNSPAKCSASSGVVDISI